MQENPDNLSIRNNLSKELTSLSDSSKKSALTYQTIASGHLVLGDTVKALHFVDSALKIKPNSSEALKLRRRIISKKLP